jgi:rhodanese-related sulfurtransferase/predicted small secreted protein
MTMKKLSIFVLIVTSLWLASCRNATANSAAGQTIEVLAVNDFEQKLNDTTLVQLIDVRTPEEFESGHIKGAANINVNDPGFESQVAALDKTKPVLVYCHSGHRSAGAADILASAGFQKIYNLDGGMMKWSSADKPVVSGTEAPASEGMSPEAFAKLVQSDKLVLVDFRAKWCKPCQKMEPMLESLVNARKDKMVLLAIDVDQNKVLVKEKHLETVPVLELYQNGKVIWSHKGEIDEATLLKETKL